MLDGALVFVDQYRFELTIVGADRTPRPFAWTGGSPNSCVMGALALPSMSAKTVEPWDRRAPRR